MAEVFGQLSNHFQNRRQLIDKSDHLKASFSLNKLKI